MKIRTQLALLVAAVVIPVALLAGATTMQLWSLQRDAYQERFLERVSGLRLALDSRLDATVRVLHAMSASPDLDTPGDVQRVVQRFSLLMASNTSWVSVGIRGEDGRLVASRTRAGMPAVPPPPLQATGLTDPAFSDLTQLADGSYVTYASVPIVREGRPLGTLYIGVSALGWLEFLRDYPISPRATLTLSDIHGNIIARTLNNERWLGKRSSPAFMDKLGDQDEGSFQSIGLEGQRFYGAFSRSRLAHWVLLTGVPRDDVETDLRQSTIAIVGGVTLATALVVLSAFWLGSRVIGAMRVLEQSARALTTPDASVPTRRLPIDEAETVRIALRHAGEELAARDKDSSVALAREGEARAEAERANAAKDEFLAMLGHELRNPLSAMKSASALLAMPAARAAVHERSRDVIDRQIARLTDLVDDMLDVARLNAGKIVLDRKLIDLAVVVQHVVASFKDAGRGMQLRVTTDLAPAWVYADETRLEQIVANLFDNACKYTPPGGAVHIATGSDDTSVQLVVDDTGAGIAADLLPRVFDVFAQGMRTLERAEGGLGLGLTVVRRLVELHAGTVVVDSAGIGQGASFRVTLPPPSSAERETAVVAGAARRIGPLRLLVIEDNVDNRELTRLLLELEGHAASAVGDGESGVAAILAEAPDLALVDVGLPGIDGFEVARRVRAAPRPVATILVALTGYGTPEDRQRALAAGFDAFMVKPFDLATFEATVAATLPPPKPEGAT